MNGVADLADMGAMAAPGAQKRVDDPAALDVRQLVDELARSFEQVPTVAVRGRVTKAIGTLIHASGLQARVGELCELTTPGGPSLWAEVVGFEQQVAILTPLGGTSGLSTLTEVAPTGRGPMCPVGPGLLGRVLDAMGAPIDGLGPLQAAGWTPVQRAPVAPLQRRMVTEPLATGVRAIDALITLGEGQRIGVFSPPGVGKSTLMGMLARGATADVIVVALIGERGREVKEFIERALGREGLARSVLVVSTSDRPPMERIQSAYAATAIAEHFRDQGQRVLLLVDSLTRFARAQREIGLASGEPPTRRSYPPSIFSMLPQLLERAGQGTQGSITAVYTVLTEGDEENDPIAEEVRSILDGHIVLSRQQAAAQRYPAIDVLASVSRVMSAIVPAAHAQAAGTLRSLLAKYAELELLIRIGEYRRGSDALADHAVERHGALLHFLSQPPTTLARYDDTVDLLQRLVDGVQGT
jgi:type III secretion protein N (ATPase)